MNPEWQPYVVPAFVGVALLVWLLSRGGGDGGGWFDDDCDGGDGGDGGD